VINLAMPTSPNALTEEAALCAQHGLDYQHLPVPWEAPTAEHLDRFFAAMDAAQAHKLLVHCALNMRVSAFMFLYRVLRLGETVEAASQDLHRIWTPNPVWRTFIEQMLHRHAAT
jgi:protein tyrosine phosphatase (PTP) superfamily phosphohydrolase (DUF442 family)